MKFTTALLLTVFAPGALSTPVEAASSAAAICGDLGVMSVDASELPKSVDPSAIRLCAEHPSRASPNPNFSLTKRGGGGGGGGRSGHGFGCSGGFCWTSCSRWGGRCWGARNHGWGDWASCHRDSDCGSEHHNIGCGRGRGCKHCGCGGEGRGGEGRGGEGRGGEGRGGFGFGGGHGCEDGGKDDDDC